MRTIINALVYLVQTAILNFKMATKKIPFLPYFSLQDSSKTRDLILVYWIMWFRLLGII